MANFAELSYEELIVTDGGWSWSDWGTSVAGAAGAGGAIGGPVGAIAGAVLGNAFYALADYYDKQP
ncbi:Blp family class II bacteriocin [Paenibacillus sp.]|jgi:hypothetical protein|uniref:Blp family class II bacteriocin n=1 Tax=Paenibacillus sp. TaxID=58172 RepID=UPI002828C8AA|nr:Blp family class II bacteriocin [Paenibacillus sp.]MDR0268053.1 Blp family class II bacteriocin [Paenibacillus sp.]